METLRADVTEWTQEQCDALNASQADQSRHPYTCGNDSRHKPLVATPQGWVCSDCDYRQGWAHASDSQRQPLNSDQILNAIEAEYKYWRDHTDDKNEGVAWQAMGAVGACANLLAVGRGLMRPRLERSVEAAGSDDGLKLLPCPFCGGEPTVCVDSRWLVIGQWAYQQIDCSVCDASMRVEAVTPREIELAWNRRSLAITPPVQKGTQDA